MERLIVFTLMMFSGSVLSDGLELPQPCDTTDIYCLSQSTEKFLEQTHKGIPELDIVAIDPLVIPSLDYVVGDGISHKYTNLTVTGLKKQKISDFKMNKTAKSVVLTTQADLNIVSDLTVVLTNSPEKIDGHFVGNESVLTTATYNYELVTRNDNKRYYEVGPETITCQVVGTPNDADGKPLSEEKKMNRIDKLFCRAVEAAYKRVVHNIRAAAKVLPASAFFKDI